MTVESDYISFIRKWTDTDILEPPMNGLKQYFHGNFILNLNFYQDPRVSFLLLKIWIPRIAIFGESLRFLVIIIVVVFF